MTTLDELGWAWVEAFIALCEADDADERRTLLERLSEIERLEADYAA